MGNILIEARAVLSSTPQRWNNLAQAFSEESLRRQPMDGEWSALECLQHLIDTEQIAFPARVKSFLAGEDFPAVSLNLPYSEAIKDVKASDLAAEFVALRLESLKVLEDVKLSDLEREVNHPRLGVVTLSNHLHEWGGHDLMHLVQAEQALMQPFIAGSGAFHTYFEKHKTNGI